ncbi:hypothetical protein LMH87_001896 [Akanthomyces muscarius]|uniref:Uncharacterized protein n=1 Tax=Akanthomyces muscarius TaxID=2231603 RepID=A0A9W8Q624_AKAMU|nr:hypothetical protein LMH87_001896 [Akanthomyces muscarius]KAJ4147372.1 hypothetical protein LMH87_001896 [Akanthomyces muscarius]
MKSQGQLDDGNSHVAGYLRCLGRGHEIPLRRHYRQAIKVDLLISSDMPENALKFCQADDMLFCHQLGYFGLHHAKEDTFSISNPN